MVIRLAIPRLHRAAALVVNELANRVKRRGSGGLMEATRGASSMADDLQVLGRKQDGLDAHKMHFDMDGTQPQPKPRGLNNIQNAER